ncbi:MAG TPA: SAM-dependent methyltransferase [Deltaproteobacteria bacterium]|nr:SAM-dependent methyltransferase [Deltaproteobacteria bacterium]
MRSPRGHPLLASLIDLIMRPLEPLRDKIVPGARGRVLEVGVGTGLNLPRYRPDQLQHLVAIEPDPHMRRRAQARLAQLPELPLELLDCGAEALPFEDASFDEAVITFTLCTIPDVHAALDELHRVLVPGGLLRFAEHTRSDSAATAWLQATINPVYTRLAGGCNLHRDPVGLLEEHGFVIEALHPHGRRPLNLLPVYRGIARRP